MGRADELAVLHTAFEDLRRSGLAVVHISAPSGIGKSALLQRFLADISEANPVVLDGRCYERESVPYKALDNVVDALTVYLRQLGRAEAASLMPRDVRALARLFPVLEQIEAVAKAPGRAGEVPDRQEARRRAFSAFREILGRIADRRPLVVAIDDLQWGDKDSVTLLADLLRPPDAPVMLLVTTWRPAEMESSPFHDLVSQPAPGVQHVVLAPMDEEDAEALARALMDDSAAEQVVHAIVQESRGNAFFVEELARYTSTRASAPSPTLPGDVSLADVVMARVDELDPGPRALLELISMAGRPVAAATAVAAAGLSSGSADAMDELRHRRLVRSIGTNDSGDLVATCHDRIREAVAASLDAKRLAGLHRRLARALEDAGGADPETLAEHHRGAGEKQRAGACALEAAEWAFAALAFGRSARLFRQALELAALDEDGRRAVQQRLAEALANGGRCKEAAEAFLLAARGAAGTPAHELRRRAAEQYLVGGYVEQGVAATEEVLGDVGITLARTPRGALASLLWQRARMRLRGLGFRSFPRARSRPSASPSWTPTGSRPFS